MSVAIKNVNVTYFAYYTYIYVNYILRASMFLMVNTQYCFSVRIYNIVMNYGRSCIINPWSCLVTKGSIYAYMLA